MGISPWAQGDGSPPWTFELEPDSGNFDISGLTTSDFNLIMINVSNEQTTTATGTFTNLTTASGSNPATITFNPSSSDVAALGMYDMRVVAKKGTANQRTFKFGIWSNEP
jgi:hypothetical protein